MIKKVYNVYFIIFCFLFLIFSLIMTMYWGYFSTHGHKHAYIGELFYSTSLLVPFCFFIWLTNIRQRGIHLVSLLWVILMPFVIYYNKGTLLDCLNTIMWPLLFEASYIFCYNDRNRLIHLHRLFYIIAIFGTLVFLQTRLNIETGTNEGQTNTVYLCLLTFPWLLCGQSLSRRIIFLLIFTSFAFLSLKRSMMLTVLLVWFFFLLVIIKSPKTRWYAIILVFIGVIGLDYFYGMLDAQTGGQLTERVTREENDEGSNRLAIWGTTSAMIEVSSPIELLFGHGHYGVRNNSILKISAHNDFLEVIYDYGLLIFILYLCLWIHVVRQTIRLFKLRSNLYLPYAVSLSIFIIMSMVSHLILYTSYFNFLVLLWGAVEGVIEKDEKQRFLKGVVKKSKNEYIICY